MSDAKNGGKNSGKYCGWKNWATWHCASFDWTGVIAEELDAEFSRNAWKAQGEYRFVELPEFRKRCARKIRRIVETRLLAVKGTPAGDADPVMELDGMVSDIDFGEVFDANFAAIDGVAVIRCVGTMTIPCSGREVRQEWTFVVPKDEIAFAAERLTDIPRQPDEEFGENFRYAFDSAKDGRMVLENGNATLEIEFHGEPPAFESLPKPWERSPSP